MEAIGIGWPNYDMKSEDEVAGPICARRYDRCIRVTVWRAVVFRAVVTCFWRVVFGSVCDIACGVPLSSVRSISGLARRLKP